MGAIRVVPPFEVFPDIDGDPLDSGSIYIGHPGLNPEIPANQLPIFWDGELSIPTTQPVRTLGGFPVRDGKPSNFYVGSSSYSISVRNKNGSLVYSDLSVTTGNVDFKSPILCKTVSDMTKEVIHTVSGSVISPSEIANVANSGAMLETVWNNDKSKKGGARYELKTLAQHRLDIGDPTWVPATNVDHYLFLGSTYVAVMASPLTVYVAGAAGDGTSNDSGAFQSCVDYYKELGGQILVPSGSFLIGTTIIRGDGIEFIGDGVKRDYAYVTAPKAGCTEIVIEDGITGFIAPTTGRIRHQGGGFKNIGFRAKTVGTSAYGAPAAYSPNTVVMDTLRTIDVVFDNVDFTCLDKGITNTTIDGGQEAARTVIRNWTAQDCNYVFKFNDGAADIKIEDCPIALHCNYMAHATSCDGMQITNCRWFQCRYTSLHYEDSQFLNVTGTTLFETGELQCHILNSTYISIAASTFSRAGWYAPSITNKNAILIQDCSNVAIQGIVERPGRAGLIISGCNVVTVDLSIYSPHNGFGSSSTGGIDVINSRNVKLGGSVFGFSAVKWGVTADRLSKEEISGSISTNGQIRNCPRLSSNDQIVRIDGTGTTIGASGSATLKTVLFIVPKGKKLTVGYMRYTSTNGLTARVGSKFYTAYDTLDVEIESYEEVVVFDNSGGIGDVKQNVIFYVYNPTAGSLTQEADSFFEYRVKYLD